MIKKLKCLLGKHDWVAYKYNYSGRLKTQRCRNCSLLRDRTWGNTWFNGWMKPYKEDGKDEQRKDRERQVPRIVFANAVGWDF